ncbi:NEDD8-activating enzyme E1 catalytic subunit [Tritrichomonas foetus]|uniref:NEDD8-activating enzyme E1 catalytic subunit n=1 Tax=Tritrichomonas foetus TaxID=1144522 RepID=A0A1J4L673_9EUKA|nr:NEDD8-activating enzyme E1 catalytic subunit [Tritrichomonas foetus]|eukprot:OHT17446.1 NEDD8-activating enzyme E1 catalytic subunit [Tritrichomonas foetus]
MISPGVDVLFEAKGPFCEDVYEAGESGREYFYNSRILVIGAGGLGCELLKSLALSGFRNIDVIDMDTIDVSNLNRQFLFRENDVGKSKAIVAAEFIKKRIPNVNIVAHFCKIQDMDDDFYTQFNVVIGGLDSINARMWISDNLCRIARETNGEITIPYIDGGTEEWKGHCKFIIPMETACMRCQSDLFPPQVVYQMCTIANNPRRPEHCVLWVKNSKWEQMRPNEKIDCDNQEHVDWIIKEAKEHARRFFIDENEINSKLVKGVIKNIIPAIASTQAVIASMCVTETLKLITGTGPNINNNLLYIGNASCGLFGNHFLYERKKDCFECSRKLSTVKISQNATIQELIEKIKIDHSYVVSGLRTPSKTIYMPVIESTKANLENKVSEYVNDDDNFIATSKVQNEPFEFVVEWE